LGHFWIGSRPGPAESFPGTRGPSGFPGYFALRTIFFPVFAVEGPMTKKDKIAFIKSSKRKTHVYNNLDRYTDQQLNDVIREIVQGLIRESEIIANAYINGYR
jgi:hypothetical protein